MLTLVIKGETSAAIDAAKKRGIVPCSVTPRPQWSNTYVTCDDSYLAIVLRWYIEDSYDVGALLFWNQA